MKQTKKNTGKEMSRAAVNSKTMSDNVIYMWLTFLKERRGDRRNSWINNDWKFSKEQLET